MDASFHVEPASWAHDRAELRAVRDEVFIQEQRVPVEEEWDELDPACDHVLARDDRGRAIGTGRLTPERKIGRMAVLADWRGHGVGAAMLQTLIDRARERGWAEVSLHAQVSAIGFYERHGFAVSGAQFTEAGIEHRPMRRTLEPLQPPPARRGGTPPRPEPVELASSDAAGMRAAIERLGRDARHALCVLHPSLDPRVFDHDDVLGSWRTLAVRPRSQLRVLVHDAAPLLADGHRLVDLAQRLSTAVQVRVVEDDEHRAYPSAFVLNDVDGFLLQPHVARPDARGSTCRPGEHAQLLRLFDLMWERAAPASVLRPLQL